MATSALGIWRINVFDDLRICISHATPLSEFARWVKVASLHSELPLEIQIMFRGALICDDTTWSRMNQVMLAGLQSCSELVELGRLVIVEHRFVGGIPGWPAQRDATTNDGPASPFPAASSCGTQIPSLTSSSSHLNWVQPTEQLRSPAGSPVPETGEAFIIPDLVSSTRSSTPSTPLPLSSGISPLHEMNQLQPLPTPRDASSDESGKEHYVHETLYTKAKGHCGFAMGALDCKDLELARREIQLALALLEA